MPADIDRDDVGAERDRLVERCNALAKENRELLAACSSLSDQLRALSGRPPKGVTDEPEAHPTHDRHSNHEIENRRLVLALEEREAEIQAIHRTKMYRYTALARRVYGRARQRRRRTQAVAVVPEVEERTYLTWVERFDSIDDVTRTAIRSRLEVLSDQPLVSIIFPVYNAPGRYLKAAIESVLAQIYTNWELCIADDASTEPHVAEILTHYADHDPRIKVTTRNENGHISAASNTALAMASGTWITPLDHDDLLAEHALALAMLAVDQNRNAGVIYSDEDKVDDQGRRHLPYFKPDFDPLLLLGQNYLTHLLFLRHDLVTAAGGYRLGYEGSQDWDLILRVTENLEPSQIVHVPHVLYHWRVHDASTASLVSAKPYALEAGQRAVVDHLSRKNLPAQVTRIPWLGHNRVTWPLPPSPPLVSIIIPTKDGRLLGRCIDSILAFTSYPKFDITVIDNGSREFATLKYLRQNKQHMTVIDDDRPFNYSALNNAAVQHVSGSVLCLLNDDTEVITESWLDEMVGHLLMPTVGAVGAKLLYPDGRIQHGGVIVGVGDVAGHAHRMSDRLSPGYCGRLLVAQNFSAVTGACMVVRRQAWNQVGGLDETHLAVAFNDVDFGLRLRQAGWGVVWTPHATLYHHESVSRGTETATARVPIYRQEVDYMQTRWAEAMRHDPAYNPNLTAETEDFALAWPPRVSYR
jgi:O-antigen biosynthesis protein